MIAGLQQMAVRAHSRGIKLIGATLTPFGNETFMADAWNPTREKHRVTVMRAVDDCGDGLHPSDSGYCKMGLQLTAIALDLPSREGPLLVMFFPMRIDDPSQH